VSRNNGKVSTKPAHSLASEYRLAATLVTAGALGPLLLGERNLHVLSVPVGRFEALIAFAYAFCAFLVGLAIFVITGFRPDPPRSFLGVRRHRGLMTAGRVLGYAIWLAAITVGMAALVEIVSRRRWWQVRDWDRSDWLVNWRLALVISSAFAIGIVVDASGLAGRKWLKFFSLERAGERYRSTYWYRLRVALFAVGILLLCAWISSWFDVAPGR